MAVAMTAVLSLRVIGYIVRFRSEVSMRVRARSSAPAPPSVPASSTVGAGSSPGASAGSGSAAALTSHLEDTLTQPVSDCASPAPRARASSTDSVSRMPALFCSLSLSESSEPSDSSAPPLPRGASIRARATVPTPSTSPSRFATAPRAAGSLGPAMV